MPWNGNAHRLSARGLHRSSALGPGVLRRVVPAITVTYPARLIVPALSISLSACSGHQSALDPYGPVAQRIADLSWALFAGGAAIFLLVLGILLYALLRRRTDRHPNHNAFIFVGGVAFPVVTLSVLLVFVMRIGAAVTAEEENALRIEVMAHQWWWEFRYQEPDGEPRAITANELHIPTGRQVVVALESADVIHTFWVPNLAGKLDVIPGMTNELRFTADREGRFRGVCNEFCGAQHTLMNFSVVSRNPDDFDRWLEGQRQPARPPVNDWLQQGQDVFLSSGCPLCHTVRGTPARGSTAPDLTHFGSRLTIGAGTLENTVGNRQAWIASSQHLKPENKMPEFRMDSESLRALADYLGSLE
ncbi:cytochrome c oxidase subunit II [Gilvimarinus sp. F26214L]|uniref:cytochrome c oxidase subunit II n=1 Tax=Gilvimarinus sp. DZF01 TaxID=3461371 RepID=UPI0040464407